MQLDPRDSENLDEVKAMLATRVEQWARDIHQEGLEKSKTVLLSQMLDLKYGPLPQWARDKIGQADTGCVERWAANLLKAQTLEEVFDGSE
jgi:hypothetical protein